MDEHSYQSSSWWFHNLDHYDHTDRKGPKVYLGEYGSWDTQLINGLSEAAFMGRMELNGDVVHMASYAPLFAKNGHTSWNPDLIYFDNENVYRPYRLLGAADAPPPPRTPLGRSRLTDPPRCVVTCRIP